MTESHTSLPLDPHAEAAPPARRGTEVQPIDLTPEGPSIHATCISLHGVGLLLRGPSGLGKSDLALRLIDGGATLVADDRTLLSTALTAGGPILVASPPPGLAGLLEVRGLGLVRLPHQSLCPVHMVVDVLPPDDKPERLPDPDTEVFLGVTLPRWCLNALEPSAPAKVRLAVRILTERSPKLLAPPDPVPAAPV